MPAQALVCEHPCDGIEIAVHALGSAQLRIRQWAALIGSVIRYKLNDPFGIIDQQSARFRRSHQTDRQGRVGRFGSEWDSKEPAV
jgi:hypothetical protein